jgi:large subunit ribosomal protein L19
MKNRYIASFEAAQIESKEIPQFRAGKLVQIQSVLKEFSHYILNL